MVRFIWMIFAMQFQAILIDKSNTHILLKEILTLMP